jgi:hypothetical protein
VFPVFPCGPVAPVAPVAPAAPEPVPPPPLDAIVIIFPEGLKVTLDPAAKVTPPHRPFKVETYVVIDPEDVLSHAVPL